GSRSLCWPTAARLTSSRVVRRIDNRVDFISLAFCFTQRRKDKPQRRKEICFFAPLRPPLRLCVKRSWFYSTQSAMNTFVSPCFFALRFDANTSFFPSGENIGNPSNVSLNVIRSRPLPSTLIL